jgi:hypothetical protein
MLSEADMTPSIVSLGETEGVVDSGQPQFEHAVAVAEFVRPQSGQPCASSCAQRGHCAARSEQLFPHAGHGISGIVSIVELLTSTCQ